MYHFCHGNDLATLPFPVILETTIIIKKFKQKY